MRRRSFDELQEPEEALVRRAALDCRRQVVLLHRPDGTPGPQTRLADFVPNLFGCSVGFEQLVWFDPADDQVPRRDGEQC